MGEYIGTIGTIYWTMLEPKTPPEEEKWNLKLAEKTHDCFNKGKQ